MIRVIVCSLATLGLLALVGGASAQDLSMCTGSFPVACCKESYAKHGPFGSATGAAKQAREFDMRVCIDRLAKKKSRSER